MMNNGYSLILPSDEGLNHQLPTTFATVGQSDSRWAEKVHTSIGAKDGSLQIAFGLVKSINKNRMDAYAGVSIGKKQQIVRASRVLAPNPEFNIVGPIRYQVIEPLKKVRFLLEENDIQPIAFDVVFDGTQLAPFLGISRFTKSNYQVNSNTCCYHHTGVPEGWVKVENRVFNITRQEWYVNRERSWGVFPEFLGINDSTLDVDANQFPLHHLSSTMRFTCPGIPQYVIHFYYLDSPVPGVQGQFYGCIQYADGSMDAFVSLEPELFYDDETRRLKGGKLRFKKKNGEIRTLLVEVVSETGFYLGASLFTEDIEYKQLDKAYKEGECFEDCTQIEQLKKLHQVRDCLVKVTDGAAIAYTNFHTIITGEWPELSLSQETSFW